MSKEIIIEVLKEIMESVDSNAVLKYLPKMANTQIVLDSGALVGELSDGMNRQLGKAYL